MEQTFSTCISVWIPEATKADLIELAMEGDRSFSAEIRRALREHVRRQGNGGHGAARD